MIELLRTNDPVTLSFVESLLKDAGIGCFVADTNMSIMEGSLGVLPRRILVEAEKLEAARRLMVDAGLEDQMS
ncbi:putative signal transducing protein [Nitratireductor sp. CH_MIT9313-5]|uniref:putative signal transducing protein n=1 Tax=Nitratireductor sp. CH_MIT9313-5 TaxID=3107764 RepID=UPI00300AAD18